MHPFAHVPATANPTARWVGVFGTLLVLGACSSGSSPTGLPAAGSGSDVPAQAGDPTANDPRLVAAAVASAVITGRDACDLLTRTDAESAVGQPLPQNTVNRTLGLCDFNAADFSAGASLTVNSWDSIKTAANSGKLPPVAVAGIGDEALNRNGSNGSNLYVRRGDEGFLLTLNGPKIDALPDHGLALERQLALQILSKF